MQIICKVDFFFLSLAEHIFVGNSYLLSDYMYR